MTWWQYLITAAAVVTALSVLWQKAILPVYKFAKKLEAHVQFVETQMTPNGGSSLRDSINRIESRVCAIEEHLTLPKK